MTDRSKLLALAEAVEKLTGPDREVDMQIELTIGTVPAPYERATSHGRPQMYFWDRTDSHAPYITPEQYTASLDCAMMLVPMKTPPVGERFRIEGYDTNGVLQPHVRASAWVVGAARVFAATPALALCAAALRAQAEALA